MNIPEPQISAEDAEPLTLTALVEAAQQGDRDAFGQLVDRHQAAVYAVIFRRLGNHAETQELCQEVFMQAMRKIGQLEDPRCFGGWLRSIAGRMAINRAVRRGPTVAADAGWFEATCVEYRTPLGCVLEHERQNQVRHGLRRLKAMDRETLMAFYFDGQSLVEMSNQFKTPVGTIKRRLHVARKRLAKELEALAPA
jgi:RNA polymerase sigma-70 factor (ECF subfamily)